MTQQVQPRFVGDTAKVLSVRIQNANSSGVIGDVDLTGKTVKFRMVNAATGIEKVAETAATVTVAATGFAQYDFQPEDVDTAGQFDAWFIVYSSGEADTFPVATHGLQVHISSTTQTAKEAYEAALLA